MSHVDNEKSSNKRSRWLMFIKVLENNKSKNI